MIVHSLVSRSYVLDLYPGNSAVEFLLQRGARRLPARLGRPRRGRRRQHARALRRRRHPRRDRRRLRGRRDRGRQPARLLLRRRAQPALRRAPSRAADPQPRADGHARGLHADGDDHRAVRDGRLDPEDVVEPTGNVPPDVIENGFKLLKPTAEVTQYATLWENLWNDEFMEGYQAMGQWARDHIPFPGAAFAPDRRGARAHQRADEGHVRARRRAASTSSAIKRPVLNIMAERDHIVPLAAAEPMLDLVGSEEKEELRLAAGHAGPGGGPQGGEGDAARHRRLVQGPQRGDLMEIREPTPADLDALLDFFERVPESERTFFKERGARPRDRRGLADGRPRPPRARVRRRRHRRRLRRRRAALRLVRSRRRRAAGRRPRARAARASAARSPAGRCCRRSTAG